jgi:probable HAF family extracellular repeat protein
VVNGQVQILENLQGIGWSAAYGINAAGTIVGDGQLADGSFRAIVWSPADSAIVLGTFGGTSSQATGVNDSGEVVGFASEASGYQHAFSMVDDLMADLGTLGGGSSYAYGVNESGEVVGYSWLADGDQHAFLDTGGTMLDLNSLIPANSGWELLTAYGINDAGQITGEGLYDGQLCAFLLTDPPAGPADIGAVPEPQMFLIIGVALALMALGLRRRRLGHAREPLSERGREFGGAATGNRGAESGRRA